MDPNILVIVLDSARAENCSLYDYSRETTPEFDQIEATVFTEARAPSNWSLPSHTSMFTGIEASSHDIHGRDKALVPGNSIWEWLQDTGYTTGVFSRNVFVTSPEYGLTTGFDTVTSDFVSEEYPFPEAVSPDDPSETSVLEYGRNAFLSSRPIKSLLNGVAEKFQSNPQLPKKLRKCPKNVAGAVAEAFLNWEYAQSESWGAFLNLTDTHHPYRPVSDYNNWGPDPYEVYQGTNDIRWEFVEGTRPWEQLTTLVDLYDGAIRQADAAVGHIMTELDARDKLDDTLVIITSDHGDCFGEPCGLRDINHLAHTGGVPEPLLHVPLLVKEPGQRSKKRSNDIVSLTQIPKAIRTVVTGDETAQKAFENGEIVISASNHDCRYDAADGDYPEDYISQLRGTATAVYDNQQSRKYIWWGKDEIAINLETDEQYADSVPDEIRDQIPKQTTEFSSSASDIDFGTEQRLQDLGYM